MGNHETTKKIDVAAGSDMNRRTALGVSILGLAATAVGTNLIRGGKRDDVKGILDGDSLDSANVSTEERIERALNAINADDREIEEMIRGSLEGLKNVSPERYQQLLANFEAKAEAGHGPDAIDLAGTVVFGHGISQILDQNIGHVGKEPYFELIAVWGLKFLFSGETTRKHLLHELMINAGLIGAIQALVTVGENTGLDVVAFKQRMAEKLGGDSKLQVERKKIVDRGLHAGEALDAFGERLKADIAGAQDLGSAVRKARKDSLHAHYSKSRGRRILEKTVLRSEQPNEEEEIKAKTIDYFINKELDAAVKPAWESHKTSHPEADENEFKKQFVLDNLDQMIAVMKGRFSEEKVTEVLENAAGLMTFASATSPVTTTISSAVVANKSGMAGKVSGEVSDKIPRNLEAMKLSMMPPFDIRIKAAIEDHVANLSGLGGFGDPPFLAMLLTFGWKGVLYQTIASFPSTFGNAVMSFQTIVEEYFPFLSKHEAHKVARKYLNKMKGEYLKMLVSNIANVVGALIETAGTLGAAGLEMILGKIGLKKTLEKKIGMPLSKVRLKRGVQFSFVDMAQEVADELSIIEKPGKEDIEKFSDQLLVILAKNLEEGSTEVTESNSETPAVNLDKLERDHTQAVQNSIEKIKLGITDLWNVTTNPVHEEVQHDENIDALRRQEADETDPEERHKIREKIHALTKARKDYNKTPEARVQYESKLSEFVEARKILLDEVSVLSSMLPLVKDDGTRREIRFFIAEVKSKIAKLEWSQIKLGSRLKGFSATGRGAKGMFERITAFSDMETMKAVLGHSRAEVMNVLPFQASCVPFLVQVLKAGLGLIPKSLRPLYILLTSFTLNIFSGGADNLVAAIVGLKIDPSLWPYVLMASIDGGKHSRIGNMANLAGCSMEEFPLKVSLCLHLIGKRLKKAGMNISYAVLVDLFCKATGLKLTPLSEQEAEAAMKKEEKMSARKAGVDAIRGKTKSRVDETEDPENFDGFEAFERVWEEAQAAGRQAKPPNPTPPLVFRSRAR